MRNNNNFISLTECKVGYLYALQSRNLKVGVFTSSNCFIGIRQKFDSEFLDRELHWDCAGTAKPIEELKSISDNIVIATSLGTYDRVTGRDVLFDKPVSDGGKGWYFIDDGSSSKDIRPVSRENKELFNLLKEF